MLLIISKGWQKPKSPYIRTPNIRRSRLHHKLREFKPPHVIKQPNAISLSKVLSSTEAS